jgi:hypothetical protein
MLAAAISVFEAIPQAISPEDHRIGVYILSLITGLLVSGLISVIKDARKQARVRPKRRP